MTATSHAIIGAAIASKFPNPAISLPLSFLSHFVVDKIPHWDVMTKRKDKTKEQIFTQTVLDALLSIFLVTLLFHLSFQGTNPFLLAINAFVAQLPDWLESPYVVFHLNIPLSRWSYQIQSWEHHVLFESKLEAPWGILTQVIVVAIFLFWAAS